ncbi:hypothetical protein MMC28_000897 [Mycoblastus sanguinarius]|nr:hypothetical protein [Mycoblastus sanguinarius]
MQFFITGCSSGLGLELAHAVLKAGHNVIASSRNPSRTPEAVSTIEELGGAWISLDVTAADVDSRVQDAISKYGPIDVLINNAGYPTGGVLETYSLDEVQSQMTTNFFGPIKTIQAIMPSMRLRKSGTIVNISSAAFWTPHPVTSVYSASKFALEGLSEALAAEVSSFNIRVLIVEPGGMRTDFLDPQKITVPEIPEAYKGTMADHIMQMLTNGHGKQALDPKKSAEAILQEVIKSSAEPPLLRLPLGKESLEGMKAKAGDLESNATAFEKVALQADF